MVDGLIVPSGTLETRLEWDLETIDVVVCVGRACGI